MTGTGVAVANVVLGQRPNICLRVLPNRLEAAREALEALENGEDTALADALHPYRGAGATEPVARKKKKKKALKRAKKPHIAFMASILVPIGGGHFYAEHGAAGAIFAAGIVGGFLGAVVGRSSTALIAACVLIVLDAVLAPRAVRRLNEKRVPTPEAQRLWAIVGLVLAFAGSGVFNALRTR